MIIIAGWLQVDRADRDRYVADCTTVVRQARTSPGCLDFAITPTRSSRTGSTCMSAGSQTHIWNGSVARARTPSRPPSSRDAQVRKYRISATEDP